MQTFLTKHADKIDGCISCFDRVVITGSIPEINYAEGMTKYLRVRNIRIFDYTKFVEPLRDEIRRNTESIAGKNGLEIDFIRNKNFRKEDRIKEIIGKRGDHPGLVHIFSALESCPSFEPWHNKKTHETYLRFDTGKCLHYYFYFIDPELGLCFLRVPTWAPFRLQFYFNGHNELAAKLRKAGIDFDMPDNALLNVSDIVKTQRIADSFNAGKLHRIMNRHAREYCPAIHHFPGGCHWSLTQVEYSADIIFKSRAALQPLYEKLVRTAIHCVKPEDVTTFLSRKLHPLYEGEIGNDFHTRVEGTRIKHHMGKASIKMYDKMGVILRVEVTANDVSLFQHYRRVEHRDGTSEKKFAPMKKTIYSLPPLAEVMAAATHRYLDFIAAIDDPASNIKTLEKISRPAGDGKRTYRGFNLFHGDDLDLFETIIRGEFFINGFTNRTLRKFFPGRNSAHISRLLKRLRFHGIIKKVTGRRKYYLTKIGQSAVTAALKLREIVIIPSLGRFANAVI
jgi:hypothetical protein